MKNTYALFLCFVFISVLLSSCLKDCEVKIETCNDSPPTEELCQAYFENWFYNKDTGICELIGYSGCSQRGFASELECEACKCD